MMRPRYLAACIVFVIGLTAASFPKDIFERDRSIRKAEPDRLFADLELGWPGAEERIESWLKANPKAARDDRLTGYQLLCAAYFRRQLFRQGVKACSAAEAIEKGSAGNMVDLQRAYLGAGPSRWSSDKVEIGLENGQLAHAIHGAESIKTLIDTGAEIGVISQSTARLLGAHRLAGSVSVGTTTAAVAGELATVDEIGLGNAKLYNLTAVVLTDEQAAISGFKLVIPLTAIIQLGRFAYVDHGKRLLLGKSAPPLGPRRTAAYWDEGGIGFEVKFANGQRGVHFDSGSESTDLFPTAMQRLSSDERRSRTRFERKVTGFGGTHSEVGAKFRNVTVRVAGYPWTFREIEMAEKDDHGQAARVGIQLFQRFGTIVFDTERMLMSVAE